MQSPVPGNALTLNFISEQPDASRVVNLQITPGTQGNTLNFGFDGQQVRIASSNGAATYTATLINDGQQTTQLQPSAITIQANEQHTLTPIQWGNLDTGGQLEIDRGQDGTVDEVLDVSTSQGLYLPFVQK